jgi:hypothetical protein
MLALVGSDVADCGEDVGRVCGSTFNAVTMIDASLAGFVVDIKVLEIVVKIDGPCAEVSTEESGVGSEYCGDIDSTFSAER